MAAPETVGTTVGDVLKGADGRVTGVIGHHADGRPFEVHAAHTIGADGVWSRVARAVGAPIEQMATRASAFIYSHLPGINVGAYEWFYKQGVTAGIIPTNDGLACVFVATSAERLRREPDRGTEAAWRRILGRAAPGLAERLDHRGEAGPPRLFPGLTGYLREAAGPGWALVGDAGYFKDPITAHGITDALRDAEILARVVASEGPGAVRRYQAERDELSLRLFRVTGRIASFDWTAEEIGGHLLELGEAMAEEAAAMAVGDPGRRLELASA